MKYLHRFQVDAPLADVVDFHRRSASMGAITPPPVVVRVHRAPTILRDGDEMAFTLWLGPLPLHWLARIEDVAPTGFADRQLRGPFKSWVHRHIFVPHGEGCTEIIDEVTAELSGSWFWRLAGLGMWLNMPILFAYRGWQTRRILQRNRSRSGAETAPTREQT